MTATPDLTIAIVPRESFSRTRHSLEQLLPELDPGTRVVCVDGGSPTPVRRYLEATARRHDLTLVRADFFLSPNQARNLAVPLVDTDYVLFVDYETELRGDAVDRLLACARATDAWIVGPAYLQRLGHRTSVHMAGGDGRLVDDGDGRRLHETHRFTGAAPDALANMEAAPTEQVEFHCMLVRRDVFDVVGPLDENLFSVLEHTDLCLAVRELGGSVWVEPHAVMSYAPPPWPSAADRAYWLVRWSDEWTRATIEHFAEKWDLSDSDPSSDALLVWGAAHRRFCYRPYLSVLSRVLGSRRPLLYDWVDPRAQRVALRRHDQRVAHGGPPRVVHAASWAASRAPRG